MTPSTRLALALATLMLLSACGGGGSSTPATPTPPSTGSGAVTLSASSGTTQLLAGASTTLTATVSDNSAVTWQLASGAPGKLSATAGASVTYTAPASGVAVPTAVNVTATAGGATKTVQLVVNPDPGAPGLSYIAGSLGSHTVVDGTGTAARFARISDMAIAADGSMVISDQIWQRPVLRHVSPTAKVTTLPAPAAEDAQFGTPRPVAIAADGAVWTVRQDISMETATLMKLDANGNFSAVGAPDARFAGSVVDGAGELYISSRAGNTCAVYRVSYQGAISLLAGGACGDSKDGRGATAVFQSSSSLTRAADGTLYMLDNYQLRRVAMDGTVTTIVIRDSATGNVLDTRPGSIAARPDGTLALLASDTKEQIVYSVKPDGSATPVFRTPVLEIEYKYVGYYRTNYRLVRSDASGRLYLSTQGEVHVVQNGAAVPLAGMEDDTSMDIDGPGATARFMDPLYIASDLRGSIYVADHPTGYGVSIGVYNDTGLYVRKIDAAGNVNTVIKETDFGQTKGLLADQAGNLYVAEMPTKPGRYPVYGGAIRKIGPGGTLTVLAGDPGYNLKAADGKGRDARFVRPSFAGIAADGTLYVNDIADNDQQQAILRKVTPDGTVTTVAALPDDVGRAPDGKRYGYDANTVYRIEADGSRTIVAGTAGMQGTVLGPLPGGLFGYRAGLTPTGLHTFALISNAAIVKLVVPH